jgi:transmembrane sensor
MMAQDKDMIDDRALDWVIRLRDPRFDDWEGFEAWMAADPAHADAYHAMAIADEDIGGLLATGPVAEPAALPDNVVPLHPAPRVTRRYWLGGAIAASIAAGVGFQMVGLPSSTYQVETAAGERKTVTLAEGTSITLNGGTRLTLDRKDPRHATLDRGEAVFAVVHDAARPFRVAVGDAELLDVGTRFNVLREDHATSVQVAEGAVVYNPKAEAVRLDPGQTLQVADGGDSVVLGHVAPAAVAGWKQGRFIYDGQPMAAVAAELTRYFGQTVRVSPAVAAKPFRGVLSLGAGDDVEHLGTLLDVDVRRDGADWVLSPRR